METSECQQQISHVPKFLIGTLGSVQKNQRLSIVPLRDMETSECQQQTSHVPKFLIGTLGSVQKNQRLSIVPLRDMETSECQQQISHVPKFLNAGRPGSVFCKRLMINDFFSGIGNGNADNTEKRGFFSRMM